MERETLLHEHNEILVTSISIPVVVKLSLAYYEWR